jgi:hypothetical protein
MFLNCKCRFPKTGMTTVRIMAICLHLIAGLPGKDTAHG